MNTYAVTTSRTVLRQFPNYCGQIKIARCGFPWKKTTKEPVASVYTNCEAASLAWCAMGSTPARMVQRSGAGARAVRARCLKTNHSEIAQRVRATETADLSALTEPEIEAIAKKYMIAVL